ncbi:MAG: peptidyl-prolyl cis-trans isomerase [Bacteroidales bacterium]
MTMLDRMRRHKSWLKWSLFLVVIAFILLYIPSFLGNGTESNRDVVASVEGRDITAGEFRRNYQAQMQMYRGAYGNVSEQMLKQLGIDQQILQQMVDEQAALAEAKRRGLSVTDEEVAQRIMLLPAFQEGGRFIGEARYRQILSMQRPPLTDREFEEQIRKGLLIDKLRAALTDWVTVADSDVQSEYNRRNEKVKLEVVPILADKFRGQVQVSDGDVASYFDAHKAEYKVGEKRKVRYALVDVQEMRPRVAVTASEIERAYNDNIETYSTPEQVRASHILLKTDGKNDEAVKAKAEQLLKEAKAGADFAELAKKNSQDEASAKNGGDLDYFTRGKMVPEFDEAAFSMEPGQISDLVKTQYGYHIIKVTDKKAASIKPLTEVRQQIVDQLTWERAQAKASEIADKMEKAIRKPADLDKAARDNGIKVAESGFVTRDEPIMALGPSPQLSAEIFGLQEGQVTGAVQTQRGFAFLTLVAKEAPHVPKLEEVRDKVRDDLIKQKAFALAQQKAAQVATEAKTGDMAKAAKDAGLEVKTTELIARDAPLPDIGVSPQVDAAAFALPTGAVSEPIKTDNAIVVVKVIDKKQPTPAEFAADKEKTRGELLSERRNRFFSAYMVKAKQAMSITVNREVLQRMLGS